jgi:hypothetical protein
MSESFDLNLVEIVFINYSIFFVTFYLVVEVLVVGDFVQVCWWFILAVEGNLSERTAV